MQQENDHLNLIGEATKITTEKDCENIVISPTSGTVKITKTLDKPQ